MATERQVVVIAGPNGAGKTTFALSFLRGTVAGRNFVNADLIAAGLAPLAPQRAAVAAGRTVLGAIERLANNGESFAFESTLAGRGYLRLLQGLRKRGYRIVMVYLWVSSPELARNRILARVRNGGHDVPAADARRRFRRSVGNFMRGYRQLADVWMVFDNSAERPRLVARCERGDATILEAEVYRRLEREA
ncbi:MAG TPA: zeta toxin family protein [Terriglobales bacterium]|nr:zeta toxin family protein [Terriglobales bacterium]